MNINTLIVNFSEALAQSATIKAWTQTNYTKDHWVFVGLDTRDPPGEDDCPYFVIYPGRKYGGQHRRERHQEVELIACLHDTTIRSHGAITNITEYTGIQNIETFRKLGETVIAGVDIGNAALAVVDIDYELTESFPFFMCGTLFDVWESVIIGSDPLL